MGFKQQLIDFCGIIKTSLLRYQLTSVIVVVLALITAIENEWDLLSSDLIFPFLLIWGSLSFALESWGIARFAKLRISQLAAAVVSATLSYLLIEFDFNYYEFGDYWKHILGRLVACVGVTAVCLGIWKDFRRRRGSTFAAYTIGILQGAAQSLIIFGILMAGVAAVFGIIDVLILGDFGQSTEFATIFTAIAAGGLSVLIVFARDLPKTATFMRVIWLYVLLPIVLIASAVIYIYIAKIILTLSFPSNQVFSILLILFCAAYFIWLPIEGLEEDNKWKKCAASLPIVFAPLLLLEIYSIGIRIHDHGLTPERYAGVAFIILQILILWLAIFNKKRQDLGIIFFVVILCFSLIFPWLNAFHSSYLVQKSRFEHFAKIPLENISEKEKEIATSTYRYLQYDVEGKHWLQGQDTSHVIEWDVDAIVSVDTKCEYHHLEENPQHIDISAYKTLTFVNIFMEKSELFYDIPKQNNGLSKQAIPSEALFSHLLETSESQNPATLPYSINLSDTKAIVLYQISYEICDNKIAPYSVAGQGLLLER